MIWEKIQELVRFHSQAHNIPIEAIHLPDTDQPTNPFEGIQILLVDKDAKIGSENFRLIISYPHAENGLESISKTLEEEIPVLARQYHQKKRDQLKELVLSGVVERKDSLKQSIQQAEYTLDDLSRQMFDMARKRNLDKHLLVQLEKPSIPLGRKIIGEYTNIKKLLPGLYQSIRFDDRHVWAKTHQVDIWYADEKYEIGVLLIELELSRGKVILSNLTNPVNNYPHPHVNDNGEICLGNVSAGLTKLLGEFEIYGALELLHKFIHEYNEDDPYQKIQYWNDPDYCDESNEYERCRESGSYGQTCLQCSDGGCPYFDGALEECQENMDLTKCVMCSDRCEPGDELLQECHDENPLGCMTCSFSTCPFYRKEESCHEVNEESCASCNIEHCKYRGVANETVTT